MISLRRFPTFIMDESRVPRICARFSRRGVSGRPRRYWLTLDTLEARTLMTASIIETVAGNGMGDYSGNGGPAIAAGIGTAAGIAVDSRGNIYLADSTYNMVHSVSAATGDITTIAGDGKSGYSGDNGPASHAELNDPQGAALDPSGEFLYIADTGNNVIRKINLSTGVITTLAGDGMAGYSGDGGSPSSAELNEPVAVAVDASGDIFIADYGNFVIREVSANSGDITTVAGDGTSYSSGNNGDGGPATSAVLVPSGVAVDPAGDIFIADDTNDVVREVSAATGGITTVAGGAPWSTTSTSPTYSGPATAYTFMDYDSGLNVGVDNSGNLLISDAGAEVIHEVNVATGQMTTIAGNGMSVYTGDGMGDGGPAANAALMGPGAITVNPLGVVYFGDMDSFLVRAFPTTSSGLIMPGSGSSDSMGSGSSDSMGSGSSNSNGSGFTTVLDVSMQEIKSGKHGATPAIVVQFSASLDIADAQDLTSYSLVTMAKSKKQKSKPVVLSKASYNPTNFTVTLTTRKKLVLSPPIVLTIKSAGLRDARNLPLDGGASGQPGSNYVATLSQSGIMVNSFVRTISTTHFSTLAVTF